MDHYSLGLITCQIVGGRRVGDVKHPKSPPGTMIQEVRERGDENMDSDIFISLMDPPTMGGHRYTPHLMYTHTYTCINHIHIGVHLLGVHTHKYLHTMCISTNSTICLTTTLFVTRVVVGGWRKGLVFTIQIR